ncbi:branched-chain amino acid ABC transporter permease [Alcaligenes sp. RM2]|uniref:branched-chain amino acid ABC transporter permease n=1 Tax=unclassified Alcaligenes TaxID=259357 RepID=UPI0020C34B16|nr:branched-chain amino acid ABC transporter permease [Alcaligenes sp. NLF5-7]UTM00118.1 branched-chain amino acid ABC transporter permease [Alcaligenes sp. NLF5-7]
MEWTIDLIFQQAAAGLALGSIYVLLAVGLTLIFGLLNVVNFSHGAFYMLGAYLGFVTLEYTQSFTAALVVAALGGAAIGGLFERFLIRRLYGKGIDYPLLLTFGAAYVIVDAVRMIFGREGVHIATPDALSEVVDLGFGLLPGYRLFLIALCLGLVLLLWLLLERTRWGLIIRAGAQDGTIIRILGIDISRVWLMAFALGSGLAALSGILAAPMRGVHPDMGSAILVDAFVVTVVGGMGSLSGAVLAGLLIGMVVSFVTLFAPEFQELSIYVLMTLMLLARPQGLLGRRGALG